MEASQNVKKGEIATQDAPVMQIKPTPALVRAAYDAIEGTLPDDVQFEAGDPEVTARAIRERIRTGSSFDEVFAPQKLPALQDYAGMGAVVFHAFHLQRSRFEGESTSTVYAVCEITSPAGEIVTCHCGGGNVLTQLVSAWEHNWFPFKALVVARDTSTPGRKTLWLEKAN